MPPRPPLANTCRLAVNLHTTGEAPPREAANIFYCNWVPPTTPDAASLVTFANSFMTAYANRVKAFLHSQSVIDSVVATMIDGTETQGVSNIAPVEGVIGGGLVQASTSMVVSWKISAAYRGGHPRTYIPFGDVSNLAATGGTNLWSSTMAAALAQAADNLLVDVNGIEIGSSITQLGTVSYVRAKQPRPVPIFYPYLTGSRVNTRIGTQRRRLGKLTVGTYQV